MALIQRTGGGTGFSFSSLRPRGDRLHRTGGTSSGPVSFMRIFDATTENIREGGKRRGANMGILRVDHPDVLEFIQAKREPGALANFNLSVGVTDAFMRAVRDDGAYSLVHPTTGATVRALRAREVFDELVHSAWSCGDPGVVFLDPIEAANPTPELGRIRATNPCGEVPLLAYESCNLGSIHLGHLVVQEGGTGAFDWDRLRSLVRIAVRFLDDVIEVNRYPLPELERAARATRKIGVGVMGLADAFLRLGVPYASEDALRLSREIARVLLEESHRASEELAEQRGPFPAFEESTHVRAGRPMRNATTVSIAPTGTLSIIADTSAGIEPLFALAYRRVGVLEGETLAEVHPLVLSWMERRGIDPAPLLESGRLDDVRGLGEDQRRLFATALEIPPDHHLGVQAAFQESADNAVSKTVNLPEDATQDDVALVYRRAWELRLKGVTVYRYGSKGTQVLELGTGEEPFQVEHTPTCDPHECRL